MIPTTPIARTGENRIVSRKHLTARAEIVGVAPGVVAFGDTKGGVKSRLHKKKIIKANLPLTFKSDLRSGNTAETTVKKLFLKAGFRSIESEEFTPNWDLEFSAPDGRALRVEVKFDKMEAWTGNIAIEYYNPKSCRPSGISSTKSDLWAIVLQKPIAVWLGATAKLKEFIKENPPVREVACGGDDNSAMKLYEREHILGAAFTRVDKLDGKDLCAEINKLLEPTDVAISTAKAA